MCFNPPKQTTGQDFPNLVTRFPHPNPGPIPPHPGPTLIPTARRATLKHTYAPSSAPKCNGKTPKQKSERKPSQSRPGKDRTVGIGLPPGENTRDFPQPPPHSMPQSSWGRCPDPSYLRRSRARPRFCSPESESMPPARHPQPPVRPRESGAAPDSGSRVALRPGDLRGGRGRGRLGKASAARSPLPARPVPLCARREREGGG